MKKYLSSILLSTSLTFFSLYNFAFGQTAGSLLPCDGTPESPCGFPELIKLVDNSILFILKFMVAPLSVAVLVYGGFLYLTSGGNAGKRTKANAMFVSLFWGLFFCLTAWVIVKIILTTFDYNDATFSPVVQ